MRLPNAADLDALSGRQAAEEGLAGQADEVAALARAALASPVVQRALAAPRRWRELAVVAELDGRLVEGFIDLVFEGAALWVRPIRSASGRLSAWVDLQVHPELGEFRQLPLTFFGPKELPTDVDKIPRSGFVAAGPVDMPVTVAARVRENYELEDGRWALLTLQDLPGMEVSLVAAMRVTAR